MTNAFQYVDGIGDITVANGKAHFELVVARPPQAESRQQRIQPVGSLVMVPSQFVRPHTENSQNFQNTGERRMDLTNNT